MYIDFKELDKNGVHFELLVQELMQMEGLDVHWEGVGQDNGKDLVVSENVNGILGSYSHKWVVQCKHNAHSGSALSNSETLNIRDTCDMVGADGYLLVCTTYLSAQLVEKLDGISRRHKILIKWWDAVELEKRLLKPACFSLIERYFPKSSKKVGFKIYSSTSPSNWLAMYKEHLFNMSCRISGHYPSVDLGEQIIDIVDQFYSQYNREKQVFSKKEIDELIDYSIGQLNVDMQELNNEITNFYFVIEDFEYLRVRSIGFDDKHHSFNVEVDYLYQNALPCIPLAAFKDYFHVNNYITDEESRLMGGAYYINWSFGLCQEWFASDHFNPNHYKYYPDQYGHIRKNTGNQRRIEFRLDAHDTTYADSFEDLLIGLGLRKRKDIDLPF